MTADDSAYTLARLRAQGQIAVETMHSTDPASLRDASFRGGRRIAEFHDASGVETVALSWPDGAEPVADRHTSATVTVPYRVLAVALRACWQDRDVHPYPGTPASLSTITENAARLGGSGPTAASKEAAARMVKSALRRLVTAGYLVEDGPRIRLGSAVAVWTEREVETLRTAYDNLPVPEGTPEA